MLLYAEDAVAQEQLAQGSSSHAASSSGDKVQVMHCHSPPAAVPLHCLFVLGCSTTYSPCTLQHKNIVHVASTTDHQPHHGLHPSHNYRCMITVALPRLLTPQQQQKGVVRHLVVDSEPTLLPMQHSGDLSLQPFERFHNILLN